MSQLVEDIDADVRVAEAVAISLRAQRLGVGGSSDSASWDSPADLWRDPAYRSTWYARAADYWRDAHVAPATVDGVLGGFAVLDAPDAIASRRFLAAALVKNDMQTPFRAADVAAGAATNFMVPSPLCVSVERAYS
mmetsp:Transcript_24438/g.75369  ORF Transcript_24438/g.75369 Transcript_24438/m.75369 type:complete len:136 (-) Transcript_24438:630-1037(-)